MKRKEEKRVDLGERGGSGGHWMEWRGSCNVVYERRLKQKKGTFKTTIFWG